MCFWEQRLSIGGGLVCAEETMDVGKLEYDNSCIACHGSAGEGDVPMAGIIDTKMPDITTLSKRNNGVFPLSRVHLGASRK